MATRSGAEDTTAPYSISWATIGAVQRRRINSPPAPGTPPAMSPPAPPSPSPSRTTPLGLIAAYALNEASGTLAADASGSGYHGTLVNGPLWVAGHTGGALSFDGVNDYVQIATLPHLPQWTISAWVRSPAAPSSTRRTAAPSTREANFQINWNHSKRRLPRRRCRAGSATILYVASFGTLAANTWYHLSRDL